MSNNRSLLGEVWDFIKVKKAWWLTPIVVILVFAGLLIVFAQTSPLSSFIYSFF